MIRQKGVKQTEIYEFIKKQINDKGCPPSIREICAAVGLKSTSTVHGHLERLEKKGLIKRDSTKTRSIEIMPYKTSIKEMINIPILGTVNAGLSILEVENIENTFAVPMSYAGNKRASLFVLKVQGDSMVDAGILDGDFSIIEETASAKNGDIVVALIENKATLRRFFKENDYIRLQPENKRMFPLIVNKCKIIGKLIAVCRQY